MKYATRGDFQPEYNTLEEAREAVVASAKRNPQIVWSVLEIVEQYQGKQSITVERIDAAPAEPVRVPKFKAGDFIRGAYVKSLKGKVTGINAVNGHISIQFDAGSCSDNLNPDDYELNPDAEPQWRAGDVVLDVCGTALLLLWAETLLDDRRLWHVTFRGPVSQNAVKSEAYESQFAKLIHRPEATS